MSKPKTITRAFMTESIARYLFHQGLSASVEDIILHAGATRMTVYKEYRSKESMIADTLIFAHQGVMKGLKAIAESDEVYSDGERRLELAFGELLRLLHDPDACGRLIFAARVEFPSTHHPLNQLACKLLEEQAALLEVIAGEAGCKSPATVARALMTISTGTLLFFPARKDKSIHHDPLFLHLARSTWESPAVDTQSGILEGLGLLSSERNGNGVTV